MSSCEASFLTPSTSYGSEAKALSCLAPLVSRQATALGRIRECLAERGQALACSTGAGRRDGVWRLRRGPGAAVDHESYTPPPPRARRCRADATDLRPPSAPRAVSDQTVRLPQSTYFLVLTLRDTYPSGRSPTGWIAGWEAFKQHLVDPVLTRLLVETSTMLCIVRSRIAMTCV